MLHRGRARTSTRRPAVTLLPAGVTERTVAVDGVDLHLLESGTGPLVVLCHGFPELAYSWRHQLVALAAAGYHAVAPDQRGYGASSRPADVADYDIEHLSGDVAGLIEVLGEDRAVVVGHDWGAPVVWHTAQRHPDRVRGVVGMSVPFLPRPDRSPIDLFKEMFTDTWFYILYFQEPGPADEELGRDPMVTQSRLFHAISAAGIGDVGALLGPRDGRGMLERLPEAPDVLPWLSADELAHYAAEFRRTGYTGPLNWYRNMGRNWELTADLAGTGIALPSAFVAGEADPVPTMTAPDRMGDHLSDLRSVTMVPGAAHWVQQEQPEAVNEVLLAFLATL